MSITSALSSALTGLSVTSRQAEILSSNVANATTPGYARRELGLRARRFWPGRGRGWPRPGVTRRSWTGHLLAERRLAQAGDVVTAMSCAECLSGPGGKALWAHRTKSRVAGRTG